MALPVHIFLPVVTQVANAVRDNARSQLQSQVALAALEVQRERSYQQARIRLAELEHEAELHAHQRDVLRRMLDVSENITLAKIEGVTAMFRDALGILREHQSILKQENQQLTLRYLAVDVDPVTQALIDNRKSEISADLREINAAVVEIESCANETLLAIDPAHGPLQLSWRKI